MYYLRPIIVSQPRGYLPGAGTFDGIQITGTIVTYAAPNLAAFAVMFIIIQLPVGSLSDRVGRLTPTAAGLVLGAVALVLMPSVAAFPWLITVMALYGIAYGMIFPSISAMVADHTAPEERGIATGIFHALLTVGVAIGAPVMGWAGGVVGVSRGLMLSGGIMVLALIVALSTRRRI